MRRAGFILISGFAAAAVAYFCLYHWSMADARHLMHSDTPELAWLKAEFHLSDAEFQRISALHEAYREGCMERCRLIDRKNAELKTMLAGTNRVTPEIQRALTEAAQLRAECQRQMLQHFYEVSQSMPPEQGRRYLAWVQERILGPGTHSSMH